MYNFWGEKFDHSPFFQIWKFYNPCDDIKSKLRQKGAKFVYYVPTVIKRSDQIQ